MPSQLSQNVSFYFASYQHRCVNKKEVLNCSPPFLKSMQRPEKLRAVEECCKHASKNQVLDVAVNFRKTAARRNTVLFCHKTAYSAFAGYNFIFHFKQALMRSY